MSEAGKSGGGAAWQSNGTYPASNDSEPNTADLDHRPDVPTPAERIRGIMERYSDRVFDPVAIDHGRKLRKDSLEEPETVRRTVVTGESDEIVVEETVRRGSLPWIAVVERMLEWYEDPNSDQVRRAPILLAPAHLTRETARSGFELSFGEGDTVLNPALREKLKREFEVDLPDLPELTDIGEVAADEVFEGVREAVEDFDHYPAAGRVHAHGG